MVAYHPELFLVSYRSDKNSSPYSLTVLPHDRIKGQEHFSISATGVCCLAPDHATSFTQAGRPLRTQQQMLLMVQLTPVNMSAQHQAAV